MNFTLILLSSFYLQAQTEPAPRTADPAILHQRYVQSVDRGLDGLRERLIREARDGFLNGNPNRQAILQQLDTLFNADSRAYGNLPSPPGTGATDTNRPLLAQVNEGVRSQDAKTRTEVREALTKLGIPPQQQSVLAREYEVIRLGAQDRLSNAQEPFRDSRISRLVQSGYIKTGPGTVYENYRVALNARSQVAGSEFGSIAFRNGTTAIDQSFVAAANKMGMPLKLAGTDGPAMVLNRQDQFGNVFKAGSTDMFVNGRRTNVFSLPPLPVPKVRPGQTNSFTMIASTTLSVFATKAVNDDLKNAFANGECPEESNMDETFAKIYFLQAEQSLRDQIWLSCSIKKRTAKFESTIKAYSEGKFKALKARSSGVSCKNLPGSDIGVRFLIDKPARSVQFTWGPDHKFTMISAAPQDGGLKTFSYSNIQHSVHYGSFTESYEAVSTRASCAVAIGQSLSGCPAEVLDTLKKSAKNDDPKSTAQPDLDNSDLESFYLLEAAMVVAHSRPDAVKTPAAFCQALGGRPPEGGFRPPQGVDRSPNHVAWPADSSII